MTTVVILVLHHPPGDNGNEWSRSLSLSQRSVWLQPASCASTMVVIPHSLDSSSPERPHWNVLGNDDNGRDLKKSHPLSLTNQVSYDSGWTHFHCHRQAMYSYNDNGREWRGHYHGHSSRPSSTSRQYGEWILTIATWKAWLTWNAYDNGNDQQNSFPLSLCWWSSKNLVWIMNDNGSEYS